MTSYTKPNYHDVRRCILNVSRNEKRTPDESPK